jgi:hypothetical protein
VTGSASPILFGARLWYQCCSDQWPGRHPFFHTPTIAKGGRFADVLAEDAGSVHQVNILLTNLGGLWTVVSSKEPDTSQAYCRWPATPSICDELIGTAPMTVRRPPGVPTFLGHVRPSSFTTSADGGEFYHGLVWTHWGEPVARATGLLDQRTCEPSCAAGYTTTSRVTVYAARLHGVRRGAARYAYYITYPKTGQRWAGSLCSPGPC